MSMQVPGHPVVNYFAVLTPLTHFTMQQLVHYGGSVQEESSGHNYTTGASTFYIPLLHELPVLAETTSVLGSKFIEEA